MAQTLHSLVKRIQTDSSLSRLAALMKQRDILARKFLYQEGMSSVLASTAQTLGEFEVILYEANLMQWNQFISALLFNEGFK